MKVFFFLIFGFVFLIGVFMFLQLEYAQRKEDAEREFILSKGRAEVPFEWRGHLGKGI